MPWPGSSPRVRGTPDPEHLSADRLRFIPARAGNTSLSSSSVLMLDGSSPRVRGTLRQGASHPAGARFIPAHAGNTRSTSTCGNRSGSSVHPRACGEHIRGGTNIGGNYGSSPRMRGTRGPDASLRGARRFIPARAGNTTTRSRSRSTATVHPRACGEHNSSSTAMRAAIGSSPRVRGTRGCRTANTGWGRFIPARAGNTDEPAPRVVAEGVHPRACGEHVLGSSNSPYHCGSSPRVRGTPVVRLNGREPVRFIPAHAGSA